MEDSLIRSTLTQGLPALGLGEELIPQLTEFSRLLLEKNQVMNLTAITEPREVATLHLLDSLSLAPREDLSGRRIIDVGTGAGFPGVPLAIALPESEVTLLDSLGKRVDWLNEVCAQLGLEGIQAIHARAEEQALVKGYRDSFDFVTARAVANLRLLGELCLPYVKVGGQFLAMKTTESASEVEEAAHCIKLLGGRAEEPVDYTIPGTQVTHRVLPIRKLAPTLKGYPRRWARIQKQPL